MKHLIYTTCLSLMLLSALGCSKSDSIDLGGSSLEYSPSGNEISFSESIATKGSVLGSSSFTQMELYAYYTGQKSWYAASAEDIQLFMAGQLITKGTDNTWSYSPVRYWPTTTDDKITFFSFAPSGEITYALDANSSRPSFSYVMSQNASDNDDLTIATVRNDCTYAENSEGVKLSFSHALTRLSLYGSIKGQDESEAASVKYVINGITISGLRSTADLEFVYNDQDKTWGYKWDLNDTPTIDYAATQGKTLYEYTSDKAYLTTSPTKLSPDEKDIFVLPQDFSSATIEVRIRRLTTTTEDDITTTEELIYSTEALPIPTNNGSSEWSIGEWIGLSFELDVSKISSYDTPMTITSETLFWTESDIDIDIHNNIYIYSSDNNIEMQSDASGDYGEFMICTNYDYNLRVPHHREEIDGSITSSHGFLFCTDDFNSYTKTYEVGTYKVGDIDYKAFAPTLLDSSGNVVKYVNVEDNLGDIAEVIYIPTSADGTQLTASETTTEQVAIVYGSNGYGYMLNKDTGLYRLLYYDPDTGDVKAFNYINNGETVHEIDLSEFADAAGSTVSFKVYIGDLSAVDSTTPEIYSFDFSVTKSNRYDEELYISSAISGSDSSYGVNKEADDPVYILRLSVNKEHMTNGKFEDVIGVEMISNGGGLITQLFPVTLTDTTYSPTN